MAVRGFERSFVGSPPLIPEHSSQAALSDSTPSIGAESGVGAFPTQPGQVPVRPTGRVVGAWRLESKLGESRLGGRWLAWGRQDAMPRLAYHLTPRLTRDTDPRASLDPLTRFVHAHAGGLEEVIVERGETWLITPYCGSYDGLMPLSRLVAMKPEARLTVREAVFVGIHTLGAIDAGWRRGLGHGPMGIEDVLIDRRGRALVELFGVEAQCRGEDPVAAAHASVRGVVALVHELATGLAASAPHRLDRSLPKALLAFFEKGLTNSNTVARASLGAGEPGFASPAEALAALQLAVV